MRSTLTAASVLLIASAAASAADARELAWMRFDRGKQPYAGMRYLWLGDCDIALTIDVKPSAGHVLELLWGSKSDSRDAVASINGHAVKVRGGGYDGFRWLTVGIPDKTAGERYEIVLKRASDKAGFIAAVRLVPKDAAGSNAASKKGSQKIACKTTPRRRLAVATGAEAFPEMRKVWDTPAPPPQKPHPDKSVEAAFRTAEEHGRQANEQFFRCRKFVDGWLNHADKKTGLIPRNLGRHRDTWNAQDSAADNYPFMVLTAALTDRKLFDGRMLDMLRTETKLTSRIDRLPDTWSFSKQAFASPKANLGSILFGSSEYVKDGLLPLTEWLGRSPWRERMLGIVDDIWKHAPVDTPGGKIPSTNVELNGEMLQALSRIYWMTGDKKYLEWAIRLGDYYLLGENHPTKNFRSLRLSDHGCEIVSGLSELYAAVHFANPAKKKAYHDPIHTMFDRILEVARDPHGMLYNTINPQSGKPTSRRICDTWGYNYNGIYTVYLLDGTEAYRQAVRKALGNLKEHVIDHNWGSADGFADSVESGVNLYNREPIASAADWLDSETRDMWSKQRSDGVIEGWHGDGNVARTSIMYALWKTQGLTVRPWRADVRFGAVRIGDTLHVSLIAEKAWSGKLVFDHARHKVQMHLPLDYPRINQFPEWFTVSADRQYSVRKTAADSERKLTGKQLHAGLALELKAGKEIRLTVQSVKR